MRLWISPLKFYGLSQIGRTGKVPRISWFSSQRTDSQGASDLLDFSRSFAPGLDLDIAALPWLMNHDMHSLVGSSIMLLEGCLLLSLPRGIVLEPRRLARGLSRIGSLEFLNPRCSGTKAAAQPPVFSRTHGLGFLQSGTFTLPTELFGRCPDQPGQQGETWTVHLL